MRVRHEFSASLGAYLFVLGYLSGLFYATPATWTLALAWNVVALFGMLLGFVSVAQARWT